MSRIESFISKTKADCRHFVVLVADGFSMHSLSCLTEPLTLANRRAGRDIFRVSLVSETGEPAVSSGGFEVMTSGDLSKQDIDAIQIVCDGTQGVEFYSPQVLNWLRSHAVRGGIVGSLGNGGYALAQAGLLEGRQFTVHWQNREALFENYPSLMATDRIFEIDGRIITCAGGAAATDLSLELIARATDAALSARVAEQCLQPGNRTGDDRQRLPLNAILGTRNSILISAVSQMQGNIEEPVSFEDISSACGVSKRQLERIFRRHVGMSPGRYYKEIRLEHARRLIAQTDLGICEIAFACGYNSLGVFQKNFRARYGHTPRAARCSQNNSLAGQEKTNLNMEERPI
ncbi:MAG: helix-turn-helix domain-containing protein [Rhodobacteraceae bacterium]|nr:helix-turn-helix domain-containing protein [Paracoccaceae bacterium]